MSQNMTATHLDRGGNVGLDVRSDYQQTTLPKAPPGFAGSLDDILDMLDGRAHAEDRVSRRAAWEIRRLRDEVYNPRPESAVATPPNLATELARDVLALGSRVYQGAAKFSWALKSRLLAAKPAGYLYIASPYSHKDPAVRHQRFEDVGAYTARCLVAGEYVYSPIAHHHPISLRHTMPGDWEFWKKIDTVMLASSVGMRVLMMPGWQESVGVTAEIEIAAQLGVPVEYVPWTKV